MAYEAVTGEQLPTEGLIFDGEAYDLGWDGQRAPAPAQNTQSLPNLPSQDFAIHLINTVKFHCGTMFYLFDEQRFMAQFALFHETSGNHADISPLWYVHYLLILAFGKAFVVQVSKSPRPPGAEFFVCAMKLLPDLSFYKGDPHEKIQVLCCIALYLQCIHCRPAAHNTVSTAANPPIMPRTTASDANPFFFGPLDHPGCKRSP